MMERIVGRDVYRSHTGGGYEVVRHDLGNGHMECFVRPLVTWEHVCELSDLAYANYLQARQDSAAERRQLNLNRACRRAQVRIRQRCKAAGVNSLATLTYRVNMTDLATAKAHLKAFTRKVRRVISGFFYIAVFERQGRGAWHIHLAIHKLPKVLPHAGAKVKSWSVMRALWLSVVGDLGGNFDEQARHFKPGHRRAPWKVAAYLSKYLGKAFVDMDGGANRYSSSDCITLPASVRMRFAGYALGDVLALVLDDLQRQTGYAGDQLQWDMPGYIDGGGIRRPSGCVWLMVDMNADDGVERRALRAMGERV